MRKHRSPSRGGRTKAATRDVPRVTSFPHTPRQAGQVKLDAAPSRVSSHPAPPLYSNKSRHSSLGSLDSMSSVISGLYPAATHQYPPSSGSNDSTVREPGHELQAFPSVSDILAPYSDNRPGSTFRIMSASWGTITSGDRVVCAPAHKSLPPLPPGHDRLRGLSHKALITLAVLATAFAAVDVALQVVCLLWVYGTIPNDDAGNYSLSGVKVVLCTGVVGSVIWLTVSALLLHAVRTKRKHKCTALLWCAASAVVLGTAFGCLVLSCLESDVFFSSVFLILAFVRTIILLPALAIGMFVIVRHIDHQDVLSLLPHTKIKKKKKLHQQPESADASRVEPPIDEETVTAPVQSRSINDL